MYVRTAYNIIFNKTLSIFKCRWGVEKNEDAFQQGKHDSSKVDLMRFLSQREPYISAKEPYISAKEPYISAKEPYISAKETHISKK